jgi:cytochrome c peroxidase
MLRRSIFICLLLATVFSSCSTEDVEEIGTNSNNFQVPSGFPAIQFPEDNAFTEARWKLGKLLFYDQALSRDSTLSCATCHKPDHAFADNKTTTPGIEQRPGTRNVPSLTNIAYHPYFLREGGVPSLEMQVLVPIQEHNEFDFNIIPLQERLSKNPLYQSLSLEAYGRELDYYVIPRAIATFERSLLSGNSKYDKFTAGNSTILSAEEQLGRTLFFSNRTNCSACHGGFNFTNYQFQNNGLYKEYQDPGRFRLTSEAKDSALFKVPSLRNVEYTAPYMFDGSLETLEEVIAHYNKGGKNHTNQSPLVKPLKLTRDEQKALVAFLKSLTDKAFITNKKFQNEE